MRVRSGVLAASLPLFATVVQAQPARPVTLAGCVSLDRDHINRLTQIETRNLAAATATAANIRCTGTTANLEVRNGDRVAMRAVDLGATAPRAQPRLLALALAELFEEVRAPLPLPPPAKEQPMETAVLKIAIPPPARMSRFHLAALGSLSRPAVDVAVLFGAGLRFEMDIRPRWGFALSGQGAAGSANLDRGSGSLSMMGLDALLFLRLTDQARFRVSAAAGGFVTNATVEGTPSDGKSTGQAQSALTAGPAARVGARLGLVAPITLSLSIDALWPLRPLRGLDNETAVLRFEGLLIGAHLGVGLHF